MYPSDAVAVGVEHGILDGFWADQRRGLARQIVYIDLSRVRMAVDGLYVVLNDDLLFPRGPGVVTQREAGARGILGSAVGDENALGFAGGEIKFLNPVGRLARVMQAVLHRAKAINPFG